MKPLARITGPQKSNSARSDAASQLPLATAAPLLRQLARARELFLESEA